MGAADAQTTQTSEDVYSMSDAELEEAAAQGDTAAQQELERRRAAAAAKEAPAGTETASGEAAASQTKVDVEV